MQQSAKLQFERSVHEYARWRAAPDDERSPAPAWWWGPAFEVMREQQTMPADWCATLGLPSGSTFAAGAGIFLHSLSEQTSLPWPDDFPGRAKYSSVA